ncbi:TPA: nucleotidyltransferase [Pseudomonas aeruginosa]|uniref:Nucleotidyltransferase n=1 Tax=Stutzerimonas stutzeri TaxID=316 RepID=A0ABD4XWK4_STUST|nr:MULTISPECIES: nucleotidyltransferase [Pseudomonadaceae]MDH0687245.1 nucleotidyltransferase [Stutzerimonas stutzeri]MDH2200744.1 nucleotidyltransferase [Pseudomonas oleovorans]UWU63986.1 nucleotidyltransferase [Pseudomonas aeruginosa]HCE5838038.1 nucleotidyltransferase [Pseudomonas aeruginosa]HCE9265608.1 nucleotidyltransferase [Pseudomonas aeruginosa]
MSVLSYLERRASEAVLSDAEKRSINTSITTLRARLISYFGKNVSEQFQFGSSTRGTILPRKMDEGSDIDYMIVFSESGYTPQTYLDRVKRFAETYYSRSEIKQSSPTIVLELNHIKFDLVPALKSYYAYQIVGRNGEWLDTNPNDFNETLTAKNNQELFKIKPTIRLVKFWNARSGYVFDSYSLEKWIVGLSYWGCINQAQYLFNVFDNLSPYSIDTQWRREKVERAKRIIATVRQYEQDGMPYSAEEEVKKLIPE